MPEVVVGVDGGGSKTHLAVADRGGRLLAFVAGPTTNHEGVGLARVREVFRDMHGRAFRMAGVEPRDVKAACYGLCGCDVDEDPGQIKRDTVDPLRLGGPVTIRNDVFVALFNDCYRARAVGITYGSGQKWLGINGKRFFMHDGWHLTNVRELVIRRLSQVHEGFRKATPFTDALLRHLGITSYRNYVVHTFFGGKRRPFLKVPAPRKMHRYHLIPVWLGRQAARGSRGALEVIGECADRLADGVMAVARRIGLARAPFDLILSGSILANIPALQGAVARRMCRLAPKARVLPARGRPVRGGLNFAAHQAWGGFPPGALREKELWYPGAR